jgi:hypothetical protein
LSATVWALADTATTIVEPDSLIVYAPVDTGEIAPPDRYATALIVIDDETGIGVEYTVPTVSLGVEPSVV